jgi:hypothetical protein
MVLVSIMVNRATGQLHCEKFEEPADICMSAQWEHKTRAKGLVRVPDLPLGRFPH